MLVENRNLSGKKTSPTHVCQIVRKRSEQKISILAVVLEDIVV